MEDFVGNLTEAVLATNNEEELRKITKIELYKGTVAAILYSEYIDGIDLSYIRSIISHTVKIPYSFYDYIIPTINNLFKISEYKEYPDDKGEYVKIYELDYFIVYHALADLLFIK
jgi:hypothetical protein